MNNWSSVWVCADKLLMYGNELRHWAGWRLNFNRRVGAVYDNAADAVEMNRGK